MSKIIQNLANMTAHRNRELLDLALAEALMDVMTPNLIVFVMAITQDGETRWLERARFLPDQPPFLVDPMWADFSGMSDATSHPHRLACLQTGTIQHIPPEGPAGLHITLFPILGDGAVESVLELHSLEPVGEHMMQVIHSMQKVYRNMQALLDYSERDSLTGLLNRKSFDDAFFKALGLSAAAKAASETADPQAVAVDPERRHSGLPEGYWLGMLDIDHFKKVNDTFGHLIGDEVLLLVARLLRQGFRFHDRLYRFGGEEFVVLMRCPGSAETAMAVFDRFRRSMEAYLFPQVGKITVSIGISQLMSSDTPGQALDRADQAVYAAKSGGRNRVIDFSDLLRQGQATTEVKTGDIELF